jgi:hypothetical protein
VSTHPAEVNEALAKAHARCNELIEAAELRGDQAGADAWLVARNAIEAAEKAMREAREKQTWRSVQGERVDERPTFQPPLNVSCVKCHAGVGEWCKFTEAELEDMPVIGGAGVGMVHRERANSIGVDLEPLRCATCGRPGVNHHYRHPFVPWLPRMRVKP